MNTFIIASAVTGVSLLWRTFRYDEENPFNTVLNRLPYVLRKPNTCGLCFTFWVALLATIFTVPFSDLLPFLSFRFHFAFGILTLAEFLVRWLALGTLAVFEVYIIDTFYQVSHYYKHAAHHS